MKVLVTGGAGFIGRWVVKHLLDEGCDVCALDNLSSGKVENIVEFIEHPRFKFIRGDILDTNLLVGLFDLNFEVCLHLAACVNVQDSIENPEKSFKVNLRGTFNLLEEAKKKNTRFILVSTCMVYKEAKGGKPINESHPLSPLSPYAATKIAAEKLTLSYYHAYRLPVVILRPFNTYGPFQRTDTEGISIDDLALLITNSNHHKHIPHIHPQSEIPKLVCDYGKAKKLLNWEPKTSLIEGIDKTREWIKNS